MTFLMPEILSTSDNMFALRATGAQRTALDGPKTLESVEAADFLGKQEYIDEWIVYWLETNQWSANQLPLCISESIICDFKLKKLYKRAVSASVLRGDVNWLRKHYVVPVKLWNIVDFELVSNDMFDLLWSMAPIPFKWCAFVVQSRRMYLWRRFVDRYGALECLRDAVQSLWSDGTAYCLSEGADVTSQDYVRLCVRSAKVFNMVTQCNPVATKEAYEEFLLQCKLGRVQDVPLVEQWFWINGFT